MKVLIIKLGALGDVIMATSLINTIQSHHHDDELVLMTSPPFAPLFAAWPKLGVQAFPRRGAMLTALRWLRREGFQRAYDLQSNDRTSVLLAFSGIAERIGNHPRFPYHIHPDKPYRGQRHIFDRMNEVLAAAGLPAAPPQPQLPAPEDTRQRVLEWLVANGLTERSFAIMHAGASRQRANKRWPHFAELAGTISQRGMQCVWAGADDDRELNATLSARVGIDATNAFDILGLAELGRHACFAVTNDSGPMHVLSAAGIPVFALFGPSNWRRNHALGQRDRVIVSDALCAACQQNEADGHTCLSGITAATVVARIEQERLLD